MSVSVALHGNLRDFGIGEVFQLIGQQRKTGILEISGDEDRIRIAFDDGGVVWAEKAGPYQHAALGDMLVRVGLLTPDRLVEAEERLEGYERGFQHLLVEHASLAASDVEDILDLVTKNTIFALLRWTRGSFHFTSQSVSHQRDRSKLLPAEEILMDGLRMVDEWRALDPDVRRDKTVFQRVARFESYRQAHPGESPERLAVAERLFLLIDGRLPVRRVIDLSRLGDFEGSRLLSNLRREELIEPLDEEVLAKKRRRRPLSLARDHSGLARLAAVLPFVFLAIVTLLARGASQPSPRQASGLERDAGLRAETSFETRRLRNGIEAYRFSKGAWPRSLDALRELSPDLVGEGALTASKHGPYYYAERGDGFVLLEPEH